LFVVLDDALGDVTFASLRRHDVYLVERNPVAYGLSATSLSLEHEPPSTTSAVVLGDPTSDLPDARDEAVDVAQALDVIPYLGVAATRAVVLAAANANVLHIAAHTDSSARGPEIHLATASVDAATILEYAIAPPLVVLLGCSSARIADRDALGALASAFIAAGAGTVVASRWTVDDAFAHRFARVFYAEHGAHDPIAALAAAQRRLLYEGVPAGQWATFVVVGGLRIKP
jgi:CHAT domain-containing protein